jgi:hypothetical protein
MSAKTEEFLKMCGFINKKPLVCCAEDKENAIFDKAENKEATMRLFEKMKQKSKLLPKAPECGAELQTRFYGYGTTIFENNFLVLLQYGNPNQTLGVHCGGSLINNKYVLTAAHCLEEIDSSSNLFSVRLGEHNCDPFHEEVCMQQVQDIEVAEKIPHPKYTKEANNSFHDIALLRLKQKVEFSPYVQPICLPLEKHLWNKDYSGKHLVTAGWGI